MLECYNHSTLEIKKVGADSVAIKGQNIAVKLYDLVDGVVTINTDDYAVGEYAVQFFKGNEVIEQTILRCKQNLKYVTSSYDARTPARVILEAIDAVLMGRATSGQDYVKVGDKQLHYMNYDELLKWRDFYAMEARKEEGKPVNIRFEKITFRGI